MSAAPDTDVLSAHGKDQKLEMRGLAINSADQRQTSSWVSALSRTEGTKHREIPLQLSGHLQVGHIFVINPTRHSGHRTLRVYIIKTYHSVYTVHACVCVFAARYGQSLSST